MISLVHFTSHCGGHDKSLILWISKPFLALIDNYFPIRDLFLAARIYLDFFSNPFDQSVQVVPIVMAGTVKTYILYIIES